MYVEYSRMSKGRCKVGAYKPVSSRYYLPESMPLILCGACLMVVLQSSEKAEAIYRKIVQSYSLPGMQAVSKAADVELPRRERRAMLRRNLRAVKARRLEGNDGLKPVFPDVIFWRSMNEEVVGVADRAATRLESELDDGSRLDVEHWWELVGKLIKVGFNRESDQENGIFRVTAETSPTLAEAIRDRSLAQFKGVEVMNDETMKGIRMGGKTYDWTKLLADIPSTRAHRSRTAAYQDAGYRLRHDKSIVRKACLWYLSRVEYSSPEEFCLDMFVKGEAELYGTNGRNEIRECDEALGYRSGGKSE